jgi:Fe-S-cluster containining protein
VTIGDVSRLGEFLKKPVEELVPEYVQINPFKDPSSERYELDLGLNIPCKFRKNNRCAVYPARPLNCRFFPMWIIARVPLERLKDIIDVENQCRNNSFTETDKEKCGKYVKALSGVFGKEVKQTERMLSFLPRRFISVREFEGYDKLEKSLKGNERQKEKKRIEWLEKRIPCYPKLAKKVKEGLRGSTALSELIRIEEQTKPF